MPSDKHIIQAAELAGVEPDMLNLLIESVKLTKPENYTPRARSIMAHATTLEEKEAELAAKDAEIAKLKKALLDAQREMRRGVKNIMGIETDAMNGDNLAVTLCTYFNDPDEDDDGENGWTQPAMAAYEAINQAVQNRFAPAERVFNQALTTGGTP